MENEQENVKLPEEEIKKENLRVRKAAYIKEHMERQRAAEDARLERLLFEQEVIEDLRKSSDDSMWQTEETRKYNQEFQEHLDRQVYQAHGISEDKLMGMKVYKSALYRGAAAVSFFLSLALTVLCGVLHGFDSNLCLFMLACTAVEGALSGKKRKIGLDIFCKILYIMIFPVMFVMFVCYELGYEAYGLGLPYMTILWAFVTALAVMPYFLYDPYRDEKKKMRDAKSQLRDIEKTAEKEIRKNLKMKEKEERKAQKLQKQEKDRNLGAETEENGFQPMDGSEKKRGFLTRFKRKAKEPASVEAGETGLEAEEQT